MPRRGVVEVNSPLAIPKFSLRRRASGRFPIDMFWGPLRACLACCSDRVSAAQLANRWLAYTLTLAAPYVDKTVAATSIHVGEPLQLPVVDVVTAVTVSTYESW